MITHDANNAERTWRHEQPRQFLAHALTRKHLEPPALPHRRRESGRVQCQL